MSNVMIMDHPLIHHKLGIMRRKTTSTKEFRDLVSEVAMLICYEATRKLPLTDIEIETPLVTTTVKEIAGKKLCIVPILRAGLHMADGILNLIPSAKVGHVGLYRNEETLERWNIFASFPPTPRNVRSL
ncbi:uracil phosphoribosyltransferase [Anaerotaenia torta]